MQTHSNTYVANVRWFIIAMQKKQCERRVAELHEEALFKESDMV